MAGSWVCIISTSRNGEQTLWSMLMFGEARQLPGSTSGTSWILDVENWSYTVRMSHRCSRLSLQQVMIIFQIWSCNHQAFVGWGGRSPETTWKMMIPSRAFPYGRIPVRVLRQSDGVRDGHGQCGANVPHRRSSRGSIRHLSSRGCCSQG